MAADISNDLSLNESSLSLLSSTFFISFAIAQIPCGIALDRIGARLSISLFMSLAVLGAAIFSFANNYATALLGQTLIGIGCAPIFTGSMLLIGLHYRQDNFSYMTAIVIAIGSIGDLLGTAPLAYLIQLTDWRSALLIAMTLTTLAAICCFIGLKPDKPNTENQTLAFMLRGMAIASSTRALWPIIPLFLVSYSVLIAIRGLWSGPYLSDVFSLGLDRQGNIILTMSIAMAIGTLMLGFLDRLLKNTKRLVIISSLLTLVPLLALVISPSKSQYFAMSAFIAIGLFGFNYPLLVSHSREFLPLKYHGRGMAFMTALSFIGVALVQSSTGWMMQFTNSLQLLPPQKYQLLFAFLALIQTIATLIYCYSNTSNNPTNN